MLRTERPTAMGWCRATALSSVRLGERTNARSEIATASPAASQASATRSMPRGNTVVGRVSRLVLTSKNVIRAPSERSPGMVSTKILRRYL